MRKLLVLGTVSALVLMGCGKTTDGASSPSPKNAHKMSAGTTNLMATKLTPELAGRFSKLALDCVHREYPNKIGHTMNSDADVGTPSQLHPAFYGCAGQWRLWVRSSDRYSIREFERF